MAFAKPTFPILQRGHRLAQGILWATPFYEGPNKALATVSDVVNTTNPATTGTFINGGANPSWVGTDYGWGVSITGNTSYISYTSTGVRSIVNLQQYSIVLVSRLNAALSGCFPAAYRNDGSGSEYPFLMICNATGTAAFYVRDNATNVVQAVTAVGAYATNQWTVHIGTRNGNTVTCWANGLFASNTGTLGTIGDPLTCFLGCTDTGGGPGVQPYAGTYALFMGYNRVLNPDEMALIGQDPFRIFRRRYVRKSTVVAPTAVFRKTSSRIGTRTGTRQTWAV